MNATNNTLDYPLPPFYLSQTLPRVGDVWPVNYQELQGLAADWKEKYSIKGVNTDNRRVCLLCIDLQNTFCLPPPWGQLSVEGAVESIDRTVRLIYNNLGLISHIEASLDTHTGMQIFHAPYWVDEHGNHPPPATIITDDEVLSGKWKVNPAVGAAMWRKLGAKNAAHAIVSLQKDAEHYVKRLKEIGRYPLMVWPFHAMLGGTGHALVSALEEAIQFHGFVRSSDNGFTTKGGNIARENYSILSVEVPDGVGGSTVVPKNAKFIQMLLDFDAVVIVGQAKSHCVAWTIADLLREIVEEKKAPELAEKVYLVEDCTDPVVIRDPSGNIVVDFTDDANKAFDNFGCAGMHVVQSTTPMRDWPGLMG